MTITHKTWDVSDKTDNHGDAYVHNIHWLFIVCRRENQSNAVRSYYDGMRSGDGQSCSHDSRWQQRAFRIKRIQTTHGFQRPKVSVSDDFVNYRYEIKKENFRSILMMSMSGFNY